MKGLKTVFEKEDAVRLLNYFTSYNETISKTENRNRITMGVLAKPEEIVVK
jgi:hypothetical protein